MKGAAAPFRLVVRARGLRAFTRALERAGDVCAAAYCAESFQLFVWDTGRAAGASALVAAGDADEYACAAGARQYADFHGAREAVAAAVRHARDDERVLLECRAGRLEVARLGPPEVRYQVARALKAAPAAAPDWRAQAAAESAGAVLLEFAAPAHAFRGIRAARVERGCEVVTAAADGWRPAPGQQLYGYSPAIAEAELPAGAEPAPSDAHAAAFDALARGADRVRCAVRWVGMAKAWTTVTHSGRVGAFWISATAFRGR
jgi:hypothetical protein